jgi:hypothetical protein
MRVDIAFKIDRSFFLSVGRWNIEDQGLGERPGSGCANYRCREDNSINNRTGYFHKIVPRLDQDI